MNYTPYIYGAYARTYMWKKECIYPRACKRIEKIFLNYFLTRINFKDYFYITMQLWRNVYDANRRASFRIHTHL